MLILSRSLILVCFSDDTQRVRWQFNKRAHSIQAACYLKMIEYEELTGLGKMSTRKLQHERADMALEIKQTLLTSPSFSLRTLIYTLVLKFHRAYRSRSGN